jgi:3-dehydroquinate synthetase
MSMVQDMIALNWDMQLRNPDPPRESYSYRYYLRSSEHDWPEFLERLNLLCPDQVLLVAEKALPAHLTDSMAARLRTLVPCTVLTFEGGEEGKHLPTVSALLDEAIDADATRSSVVVALGGGLAGNVAGLMAGLCLRGLPLVHVPTTLLAQSDSVLSLKQGVNGRFGKNHAGLFKAPAFVWSHLSFLESLPPREIRAALCEVTKNALAIRPDQIPELLSIFRPHAHYSQEQLARLIELCIEAKTAIMANDALEKHEAVSLEYGHTVGHAIELAAKGTIPHGEAIGIGMIVEGDIARRLGMLDVSDFRMHQALLLANGAPITIPAVLETEHLLRIMRCDNKRGYVQRQEGTIDMVLLETLGRPHRTGNTVLTHVEERDVRAALNRCRES